MTLTMDYIATMSTLSGKKFVIFGVANHKSLAWAIAQKLKAEGAELAFNYLGDALEKRVRPLAEEIGASYLAPCDVANDQQIKDFYQGLKKVWDRIDGVVHSVAFASRDDLHGTFLNCSRQGYALTLDISAYSFNAVLREALPMMTQGGSAIALTYFGSEKVVPGYDLMGVAKAALECGVRYLAAELGSKGIRVNSISAGPVRTLASSGIKGFRSILDVVQESAPLKRNITPEDVAKSAYYLLSDLSSGVTGENHHVDSGFHTMGFTRAPGEGSVSSTET